MAELIYRLPWEELINPVITLGFRLPWGQALVDWRRREIVKRVNESWK